MGETTYRNQKIVNAYRGASILRANKKRVIGFVSRCRECSQQDFEIILAWERYFFSVGAPFLTTSDGKTLTIWKLKVV